MAKIPMDKLFEVPPHEDAPDYARDLGQGIIESVLGSVADKAKRLATESVVEGRADGLDQLVAAAERLRALRSVLGGEGETGGPGGGFWQAMSGMFAALSQQQQETMKLMAAMQEKAEDRTRELVAELRRQQEEHWQRLQAQKDPNQDILTQLGLQTLKGALQQPDPLDRFIELKDKLQRAMGLDPTTTERAQVLDLEKWKAMKEIELREKELEHSAEERRAERAERERRAAHLDELIPAFASALGAARGPVPAPTAPAGGGRGFHRYTCPACATTFALDREPPQAVCPACGTPVTGQADGNG